MRPLESPEGSGSHEQSEKKTSRPPAQHGELKRRISEMSLNIREILEQAKKNNGEDAV